MFSRNILKNEFSERLYIQNDFFEAKFQGVAFSVEKNILLLATDIKLRANLDFAAFA